MQLWPVVERVEQLAIGRPFGDLPRIRKEMKALRNVHRRIFYHPRSIEVAKANWDYTFHYGGRRELQFNIGLEDSGRTLRYGVAFSFQGSRNLTNLEVLRRSVDRFNYFVKKNPAYLSRFSMWTYEPRRGRTERLAVRAVPKELFRWGRFVFVGSTQPARARSIDYERILDDLDWLVALYEFVEGKGKVPPVRQSRSGFVFQPGCSIHRFFATAILPARSIEIDLRHKQIQQALHGYLGSEFGPENVRVEFPVPDGFVDLAVQRDDEIWYYEVKVFASVRKCLRQALGQLLEYAYWPRLREAAKLIVVGEEAPTADSRKYISVLRKRFGIPIEYQQFKLSSGELIGQNSGKDGV